MKYYRRKVPFELKKQPKHDTPKNVTPFRLYSDLRPLRTAVNSSLKNFENLICAQSVTVFGRKFRFPF